MDFSQVKAITIPEGSVNRILSGSTVLWEKIGGLPPEYQKVEYLQGDGSAYIDTGYYPNTDTVLTAHWTGEATAMSPFAARWTGANAYDTFGVYISTNARGVYYYGRYSSGKYENIDYPATADTVATIGIDSVTVNGVSTAITRSSFTSTYPLYVFAMNSVGSVTVHSRASIYTLTCTENDVTTLDLVPCYRIADGVAGMYDLVSGTFFTNAGTGAFTVGPEVYNLPSSYQQVEYIEGTGTQYVDTGIVYDGTYQYHWSGSVAQTSSCFLGAVRQGHWTAGIRKQSNGVQGLRLYNRDGFGTNAVDILTTSFTANTDFTAVLTKDALILNDTEYDFPVSRSTSASTETITILSANVSDPITGSAVRCRQAVIKTDDEAVLFKGIPCYRKSDGVIGMYDLVSATFFTNSGSGTFSKGVDVT